jgi:hypothetical protein
LYGSETAFLSPVYTTIHRKSPWYVSGDAEPER